MESFDKRIEFWIEQLENDKVFDKVMNQMEEQAPDLLAYFYLPQFEDLTEDEGSFLLFIGSILYASLTNGGDETVPAITLDQIQEFEDRNWKMWEKLPGKSFDDKVNALPDPMWDPAMDLIVTMIEHDPEIELNWPPAVQEILFVSLLSFYHALSGGQSLK